MSNFWISNTILKIQIQKHWAKPSHFFLEYLKHSGRTVNQEVYKPHKKDKGKALWVTDCSHFGCDLGSHMYSGSILWKFILQYSYVVIFIQHPILYTNKQTSYHLIFLYHIYDHLFIIPLWTHIDLCPVRLTQRSQV